MKSARVARTARFYHAGELLENQTLQLPKQASHHLVTVLRTRQNDTIELFNGDGYNYPATVTDTGQRTPGKQAQLQLHSRRPASADPELSLTLVQAVSRGDKMDTTLRQCVELGINHFQPLYSRQSAKALDDKRTSRKMEHWHNIMVSACEQSGRTRLPELAHPLSLSQWLDSQDSAPGCHYILAPAASHSLTSHLMQQSPVPEQISLLIGPESGFDPEEIELATRCGMHAVRFGPRVLRTETAGAACVAAIQSLTGDLR